MKKNNIKLNIVLKNILTNNYFRIQTLEDNKR